MIIFTHHTGEPHGILGTQVAAAFFEQKLSIPSIVVGIERDFAKEKLLHFIDEYYEGRWSPTDKSSSLVERSCGATSRPKNHNSLMAGEKMVAFSPLWQKRYHQAGPGAKRGGFYYYSGRTTGMVYEFTIVNMN